MQIFFLNLGINSLSLSNKFLNFKNRQFKVDFKIDIDSELIQLKNQFQYLDHNVKLSLNYGQIYLADYLFKQGKIKQMDNLFIVPSVNNDEKVVVELKNGKLVCYCNFKNNCYHKMAVDLMINNKTVLNHVDLNLVKIGKEILNKKPSGKKGCEEEEDEMVNQRKVKKSKCNEKESILKPTDDLNQDNLVYLDSIDTTDDLNQDNLLCLDSINKTDDLNQINFTDSDLIDVSNNYLNKIDKSTDDLKQDSLVYLDSINTLTSPFYKEKDTINKIIQRIGRDNDLFDDVLDAFCFRIENKHNIKQLYVPTFLIQSFSNLFSYLKNHLKKDTKFITFILNDSILKKNRN